MDTRPVPLVVPRDTPIQIALVSEVRVRQPGQPLQGRVMQPVYAFDRLVIPVGTKAIGHISAIEPIGKRARLLHMLDEDFTPSRRLVVVFEELILPDGRHVALHAAVSPASGQVLKLSTAAENKKKNSVKDAATQQMDQARAQWNSALQQIRQPGKAHRALRYVVSQLPVHPQYIDPGTIYAADLTEPLDFGVESSSMRDLSRLGTSPPAGSLAHATLITPLDSKTSLKGSDVEAVLSQPIIDQQQLILPAMTELRGTVLQVRPARWMHRSGQLRIAFRQIVLPTGALEVDTSLLGVTANAASHVQVDAEGATTATPSKARYLTTGLTLSLALVGSGGRDDVGDAGPAAGGATGFKLIGLIVGLAFRSHSYGVLMSAYGGGRSIYNNLLSRGPEVTFPRDTNVQIGFGDRKAIPMPVARP